jgi:hypothetical protein
MRQYLAGELQLSVPSHIATRQARNDQPLKASG